MAIKNVILSQEFCTHLYSLDLYGEDIIFVRNGESLRGGEGDNITKKAQEHDDRGQMHCD